MLVPGSCVRAQACAGTRHVPCIRIGIGLRHSTKLEGMRLLLMLRGARTQHRGHAHSRCVLKSHVRAPVRNLCVVVIVCCVCATHPNAVWHKFAKVAGASCTSFTFGTADRPRGEPPDPFGAGNTSIASATCADGWSLACELWCPNTLHNIRTGHRWTVIVCSEAITVQWKRAEPNEDTHGL